MNKAKAEWTEFVEKRKRKSGKVAERSLDYAPRRAKLRRERKCRAASLGMTILVVDVRVEERI